MQQLLIAQGRSGDEDANDAECEDQQGDPDERKRAEGTAWRHVVLLGVLEVPGHSPAPARWLRRCGSAVVLFAVAEA
jgi:hypothetical protein